MTSLAFGVAGAVIGSYFGMPQLGFIAGAYLGGMLEEGPHTDGPRLNDKSIQASTYGIPIPIVRGTARVTGNIIYAEPLREVANDEGGKGGPEPSSTSYSYYGTFAVSLCNNEISAVRKIWADGKLIWDARDGNSGPLSNATGMAERLLARVLISDIALPFVLYTGTETQLADPTMESYRGAGNVPAYRGQAYIVFTDLPLENYGNRIPNLSFEVVESGAMTDEVTVYDDTPLLRSFGVYNPLLNEFWQQMKQNSISDPYMVRLNADTGEVNGYVYNPDRYMSVPGSVNLFDPLFDPATESVFVFTSSGRLARIDAATGVELFNVASNVFYGNLRRNPITGFLWANDSGHLRLEEIDPYTGTVTSTITHGIYVGDYLFDDWLGAGWLIRGIGLLNYLYKIDEFGTAVAHVYTWTGTSIDTITYDSVRNLLLMGVDGGADVVQYNVVTGEIGSTFTLAHVPTAISYDRQRDLILATNWASSRFFPMYAIDGRAYKDITGTDFGSLPFSGRNAILMTGGASSNLTDWDFVKIRFDVVTEEAVLLSDIVEDICVRAGLDASDVDVTELTDLVLGYVMTRQGSAGACLQQLAMAFLFDGVESDDVIKFHKRGQASVVTIAEDDLAAHEYGSSAPDVLTKTRRQDVELPTKLNIIYAARALDYAQGTQASERLAGAAPISAQIMSVEAPIVMSDDYAKQLADALMFNAWTERTRYQFATGLKYAEYEPTDVITVVDKILRITKKDESGGLIKFEGVADDAAVYAQAASGVAGNIVDQEVAALVVTFFTPIDCALLRDVDDDVGFYAAVGGYQSGWGGAILYKSTDGGATYASVKAFVSAASQGTATAALGDFFGGNVFDELNTLTVAMWAGATLTSSTREAMLGGANGAALKSGDYWEIIQYRTATLNADGTYTLTGLLRGRRGSDYAMADHATGDRFVVLDESVIKNLTHASAEIGVERLYKGVTIGDTVQATDSHAFTDDAVRLECLSPGHLGGGRNASLDVIINWRRRTRIGMEWRDLVDVPLGEDSELYDVEIYTTSGYVTVARTFSNVTSETKTYTVAQQTTDFGSAQSTVYVKVYQLSTLAGRGFAASAAI